MDPGGEGTDPVNGDTDPDKGDVAGSVITCMMFWYQCGKIDWSGTDPGPGATSKVGPDPSGLICMCGIA